MLRGHRPRSLPHRPHRIPDRFRARRRDRHRPGVRGGEGRVGSAPRPGAVRPGSADRHVLSMVGCAARFRRRPDRRRLHRAAPGAAGDAALGHQGHPRLNEQGPATPEPRRGTMRLPLAVWGNRLGKTAIIAFVAVAIGGTGWLAGHGAASPEPPVDKLPVAVLEAQVIKVGTGSIVNRLTVDATIQADPPAQVFTTKGGSITKIYRKVGRSVRKGDALVAIRSEGGDGTSPQPESPAGQETGGTPSKAAAAPKPVTRIVYANVSGKITQLPAPVGKQVAPGDPVALIDRKRFRAVAAIPTTEIYKLYNRPKSIKLAIDHGPAPFGCALIDYGAGVGSGGKGGSGGDGNSGGDPIGAMPEDGGGQGGSGVQVNCRIPSSQKVFAGIPAKMSITTDSATDVAVVPLSAVLGQADKGRVTVVGEDGRRSVRAVKLGINDGTKVQIIDGLEEGERILDRAPEDPAFSGPPDMQGEGPGGPMEMP